MKDKDCIEFLQWALPQLHPSWRGFRRVRGQVCKRVQQRLRELELPDIFAYRRYLEEHTDEWAAFDLCCRITISRFYRDRSLFDCLRQQVLPILAQQVREQGKAIWIWSAGCASGEEAYTLNILWKSVIQPQFPDVSLHIVATDVNSQMLERAGIGCYRPSSLKELSPEYRELAFEEIEQQFCIRPKFQDGIYFMQQDIRTTVPKQTFHLILCRNLVFTYFDESLRQSVLHQIVQQLQPGGFLMLGKHERLPDGFSAVMLYSENLYRRACSGS